LVSDFNPLVNKAACVQLAYFASRREESGGYKMKDVTVTVFKTDKGYRVIVNDDTVNDENAEGSKSNDSAFTFANKGEVGKKLEEIVDSLE
jgi:hypothetical protein